MKKTLSLLMLTVLFAQVSAYANVEQKVKKSQINRYDCGSLKFQGNASNNTSAQYSVLIDNKAGTKNPVQLQLRPGGKTALKPSLFAAKFTSGAGELVVYRASISGNQEIDINMVYNPKTQGPNVTIMKTSNHEWSASCSLVEAGK